ncbi:MAG: hypothetical protein ABSC63_04350 [Candidatus Binataceae bacterium]|jgi:hypothetical protein
MKKAIKLRTAAGQMVKVMLDNWGGGIDRLYRRWTLEPGGWHCVDNGEIAQSVDSFLNRPIKLGGVASR